jgi:DNA-directed RNA polymerase subunit K/omega
MMSEPSIEKLTKDGLNRYEVCIATAKIARRIIDEQNEEANRINANSDLPSTKKPVYDDKPVKTAVHAIDRGDYTVKSSSGNSKE